MNGLTISLVLINFLSALAYGSPVVKPVVDSVETKSDLATESAILYRKAETIAPSVGDVDSMVNDLGDAKKSPVVPVEEVPVIAAEKTKSVPVEEIPVEKVATVSTTVVTSETATEKKVKKGKSEKGQVEVVKKVEKAEPVVAEVSDSTEVPVKNEVSPVVPAVPAKAEPAKTNSEVKTESTSSDITAYLAEPINQATKLLVDLEEQIKGYLNTDLGDAAASTLSPLSYGANAEEPAIEPTSSTDARQNEQISGMVDQIEMTIHNLDQSIEDLMANRRYMTAAMMRSMRSYLRGVQNNLQRLQNRLRALQAVASSASAPPANDSGNGDFPSNAFFESLRVRINRITSDITNLMTRMRSTLVSSTTPRPASG